MSTNTQTQNAPTLEQVMARMQELEAQNAALEAEAQVLRAAVPEKPAAFEPTFAYVMRPVGWDMYADDPKRSGSFLLTRPKLEVSVQLTRNGNPRVFREDAAAWRVLLAHADVITQAIAEA